MNNKIKDILNKFIENWADKHEIYIKSGIASNINGFIFDFTPNDGGADIECRMSISGNDSFVIVPKEGSTVIVAYSDKTSPYCLFVQEAQDIYLNSELITLNGGYNDGMVKVSNLVDRLNNIEKDINDLKTVFSTWTPVPEDGGSTLKGLCVTWYSQQLIKTIKEDIENTKILQ